jgi:hypothetical protein
VRPARSLEGVLIVACVVLVALFGFVCALNQDGDRAMAVRSADGPAPSPNHASTPLPEISHRLPAGPAAWGANPPLSLLAAVPGALCLLT